MTMEKMIELLDTVAWRKYRELLSKVSWADGPHAGLEYEPLERMPKLGLQGEAEAKESAAAMLAKERDRDNAYLAPPRSYWFDGVYDHVMVGGALRVAK